MQKNMSDILTNKEIVPNKELEIPTYRSQQNPPSSSNSNMPIANCNVELSVNPSFRHTPSEGAYFANAKMMNCTININNYTNNPAPKRRRIRCIESDDSD